MRLLIHATLCAALPLAASCGLLEEDATEPPPLGDPGDEGEDPFGLSIAGSVVDFATGRPIDGTATVSVAGLVPPPTVTVTGPDFAIEPVPANSVVQLLAGSLPDYRATYDAVVAVEGASIDGAETRVLGEARLAAMATELGVTPAAGTAIVMVHMVDAAGASVAGIATTAFQVNGGTPPERAWFLDGGGEPDAALNATSTSGWAVFYDVAPGQVRVEAAPGSGRTFLYGSGATAANAVTLLRVEVSTEPLVVPAGVSFAEHVVPIFEARGCQACHSGSGIGRDFGDLTLDGGTNLIYRELTEEISPNHGTTRVNTLSPSLSLLLTMPLYEAPPDRHPNVTFQTTDDADYRILMTWISEGALDN